MLRAKYNSYLQHYKEIIHLGTPIVLGQLGIIVLGFVDTIMVGHYSANALSASGFVNSVFNLAIIMLLGFSLGATPVIGSHHGRGEIKEVGSSFKDTLFSNLAASFIIIIIYIILYINLHNLGQPQELLPLMKPYFLSFLFGIPFIALFNTFKQFTDTIGFTKIAMWIIFTGNILNIVLNYLLIFGKMGFPSLGLTGAGIATLISRMVMIVLFAYILFGRKKFEKYLISFRQTGIRKDKIIELFRIGTPLSLQMGMETASFSLASMMMGWLGTPQLAAFQIMCIVGSLCFLVYYGIGAASAIQISHYRGIRDWINVRSTSYASFHLTTLTAILLSLFISLFQKELGTLFTNDTPILAIFSTLLIPMLAYQISDGIQINFANSLRGIGVTRPLVTYAFISYIALSLPISYVLGFTFNLGAVGICFGLPIGLTTAALLYYYRFKKEITKRITRNVKL